MKYLQHNNGGTDSTTQGLHTKTKRKKDHTRAKEEDISIFFTSAALSDTDGNTQAKSRRPTGAPVRSKTGHARPIQDPSRAPGTVIPRVESEGEGSFLGFGSRGPRHESTSYFPWSDSMRAPSATPGNRMGAQTDEYKRIRTWDRGTDQALRGGSPPGHHEVPTWVVDAGATASSNRVRMSPIASMQLGISRSQSLPHPSSSLRRPHVVNRTLNRHTYEDMTSRSSRLSFLHGYPHAGHQEGLTTANSIRTSHINEGTELMRSRASIDALENPSANERPLGLVESGGTLRHCEENFEAVSQRGPTRKDRCTEACPSARSFDTDRQGGRNFSHRTVEVSAAQLTTPIFRALGPSNSFGSSIYVQQERRQLLSVGLGLDYDGGYNDPNSDCCGQEYISEAGIMDHEDVRELPGERLPCKMMEELDDDVEGWNYVADGVEQVLDPKRTSIVRPGFWRPNKLY